MKTWLITGISRGLGKALAEAALARGDTVVGTVRGEAAPDVATGGGTLHVLPLEVGDAAAVAATVERAFALAGRVDVVVTTPATASWAPSRRRATLRWPGCSRSTCSAPCG